jgi:uncharacterized membrane protein
MPTPTSDQTADNTNLLMIDAERMTLFTDAVLAIAITLLALGLPVPTGNTNAELLDSMDQSADDYLAFLISFFVIASHWRAHHFLFRHVDSATRRLNRLNMYWLLMQVITPFATEVISGEGAFEVRFVFYALVQTVVDIVFLLMLREIQKHHLYRTGMQPQTLTTSYVRAGVLIAAFGLSIPIAFFTHWAYLCWIALPVVAMAISRLRGKRASAHNAVPR